MRLARFRVACFLLAAVVLGGALRAEPKHDWDPEHTWVFAVGLLEWEHEDLWPSFPEAMKNRRDEQFVEWFRQAGVPDEQIVYLQDAQAKKEQILDKFGKLLDETDDGDLLVFYFAGHGYRDAEKGQTWFANYDAGDKDSTGWNVKSIFRMIEDRFSGSRALLLADCCHSGALYDETLRHVDSKIAYAALTSAYSHNLSTGNWTFTDALLAGLRGRAVVDNDSDGVIELHEMAWYTELEMAFIEEQKSMFTAAESFPREARLAAARGPAAPRAGERVLAFSEGQWYKAKILGTATDGRIHVHYVGFDSSWDEWLPTAKVRVYRPHEYAVGTPVEVQSDEDGEWYGATVRRAWYGLHLVRYDDYDASWDEWVGPAAIRRPSAQ